MTIFRKLYYKLLTLFCIISTFVLMADAEEVGLGAGIFCIFVGFLCFGSWAIGKEEIDPDKPIRNILMLLLWSLFGFGIMSLGISFLINSPEENTSTVIFLILSDIGLVVAYIISIIKNKDIFAIISIVLFVAGFVIGMVSNGIFIVGLLSLLTFLAAFASFIYSLVKGVLAE